MYYRCARGLPLALHILAKKNKPTPPQWFIAVLIFPDSSYHKSNGCHAGTLECFNKACRPNAHLLDILMHCNSNIIQTYIIIITTCTNFNYTFPSVGGATI